MPRVFRRCLRPHGCSGRRRARPPARLGGLTSFGAAPRSPPVPSGPSGALHTSGAGLLIGVSARSPARPRRRPPAPRHVPPAPSTPAALVSLGLAQPGLAAAHRHCGQARVLKPGQAPRRPPIGWGLSLFVASALIAHRLAISHVIPLCVLQTMNLYRRNCTVCGWSRKVTAGNYVRLLFSLGPAATRRHRGRFLRCSPVPSGPSGSLESCFVNFAGNSPGSVLRFEL